jgi:two-component system, chemotaxis family, chemotaxis protein CheY
VIVARVLIADDDAEVHILVRRVLHDLGHRVADAYDGAEALRLLESTPFDLVVADVYMGEVDGMELLVRIQQRGLRVPVLAISGGGYRFGEDVLKLASACGAAATLEKPFSAQPLRTMVERLLTRGNF